MINIEKTMLQNIKLLIAISSISLIMTGCTEKDNKTADTVQTNTIQSKTTSQEEKGAFTPTYFEGMWCYTERVMSMNGGEAQSSKMNMGFEFKQDGDYYYQQHSKAPMELRGKWTIDNGNLVLTPTFMNIVLSKVVDKDKFEFGENKMGMSMMSYMVRGACKK